MRISQAGLHINRIRWSNWTIRIPAMRLSKEKNQTYILKSKRLSSPFQYDANIIKKVYIAN